MFTEREFNTFVDEFKHILFGWGVPISMDLKLGSEQVWVRRLGIIHLGKKYLINLNFAECQLLKVTKRPSKGVAPAVIPEITFAHGDSIVRVGYLLRFYLLDHDLWCEHVRSKEGSRWKRESDLG